MNQPLPEAATPQLDRKTRVKSILGGSAGNLVEWYDWYVYAAFTLYFASQFFPDSDNTVKLPSGCCCIRTWFLDASDWRMDYGDLR